ncbi:uncharacterized protein LOC117223340 [Megalopta genalis]|uniref:uncharacterized protein LOC117223340 n=1 Tax=Megalopta genalis TaxID=115081 RepID=UPI003FD04C17
MSDIKSVLSLLCQHLKLSVNVIMKPEYFRLAKFNDCAENVIKAFWEVLNVLSFHVIQEKQIDIDFQHYDTVWATKLYFAYLQYPSIEFYASNRHDKNSRYLLLAFAWLLVTQNTLDILIRKILSNSALGRECSKPNNSEEREVLHNVPETLVAQLDSIIHLNGKVNYNIREIYNLVCKRANLVSRVHAATINVSGLPHLSVSELALVKRIATADKCQLSKEDERYLQELHTAENLLDAHSKWQRKEHIFFEWMVTVVQEHKKHSSSSSPDIDWNEIFKFVTMLHCIMQGKFEALSSQHNHGCQDQEFIAASRLMRVPKDRDAMEDQLRTMSAELERETKSLSERKEKLSEELKKLLHLIPSCIQL